MERANVECRPLLRLHGAAKRVERLLADLVAECLPRNRGRIAQRLGIDLGLRLVGVVEHVLPRALERPPEVIHARVDDKTGREKCLEHEAAEAIVRVIEQTHFIGQARGILRPAFGVRVERKRTRQPAECRQRLILELQRNLEVMSGHELVIDDGHRENERAILEARAIEAILTRGIARRRRLVVTEGHARLGGLI